MVSYLAILSYCFSASRPEQFTIVSPVTDNLLFFESAEEGRNFQPKNVPISGPLLTKLISYRATEMSGRGIESDLTLS